MEVWFLGRGETHVLLYRVRNLRDRGPGAQAVPEVMLNGLSLHDGYHLARLQGIDKGMELRVGRMVRIGDDVDIGVQTGDPATGGKDGNSGVDVVPVEHG